MSKAQLRNTVIHKIYGIEDEKFLKAINVILDTQSSTTPFVYKLTKQLKKDIKKSKEQIARGEYFTNEEVEKEMDQWLNEK